MSPQEWKDFKEFGPFGPPGKIETLANEVGMLEAYNRVYKIGSEVIHCQDLLDYVEKIEGSEGLIFHGFSDKNLKASLGGSIINQFIVLSVVNRLLRLDLRDKLRIVNAKLSKMSIDFAKLFPNGWDRRK